jgi:methylthioribose-1-phosphate isomerase
VVSLNSIDDICNAIISMQVRGAPLIGLTAAYGFYFSFRDNSTLDAFESVSNRLIQTRPTAVNIRWVIEKVRDRLKNVNTGSLKAEALLLANELVVEDAQICKMIGHFGAKELQRLWDIKCKRAIEKGQPRPIALNVLTHCNAGMLAASSWGTALSPIYQATESIPIHVWVDETRPRNQGASLTCWELMQHGIDHTLVVDNAGGHLMQEGLVDCCIVGSDRATARGDIFNKIGTYLKALAARDNQIPFYAAVPMSTIDFNITDNYQEITIEERTGEEVRTISGVDSQGVVRFISIAPPGVKVSNFSFDVTPARLVTAIFTEKGIVEPNVREISSLMNN